ncbi:MAG: bifunctional phosphoribosylaminoimidazolecarboxamide formyltransferase/inosine monophosphate cyclohydrolase, partial [Candidatus Marinimicrobia bacterium]|nr:bifunctional phosphoribosylaminoimidazolecarboxamide formyltransferase/inosine monophosphate cyclohydrolase [Candidatus Neomarinimicrobiota bacterium]
KKNLRLIEFNKKYSRNNSLEYRDLNGGLLIQESDIFNISKNDLKIVTKLKPKTKYVENMLFGWKVLKHIKSNAILIVKNFKTIGIGAGQVSRIDSVNIAINKSLEDLSESVLCSDAFFPFRDSIDKIANTGIKTIIQPGGSIKDDEVIQACNEHKISMVFTGHRCFKH